MEKLTPIQTIQLVLGGLLIAAGVFLGYKTFTKANAILEQPAQLSGWLELRASIHPPAKQEEKSSLLDFKPQMSLIRDEQVYVLGGYLTLFVAAFFLLVAARIAAAFLTAGSKILSGVFEKRRESENQNQN